MMQIDIRANVVPVMGWLDDAQKRQVPFATALAMTRTAQEVKSAELAFMRRIFDRPTPYTMNALRVKPATKRDLVASVEFKEFAGKGTPAKRYLNPHVNGGVRSHKRSEKALIAKGYMLGSEYSVLARSAPHNAYGNMNGGIYTQLLFAVGAKSNDAQTSGEGKRRSRSKGNQGYFVAKRGSHLKPGVYRRDQHGLRPILIFTAAPSYRKRFPFYEIGQGIVESRFPTNFEVAFQYAMGTARTPR